MTASQPGAPDPKKSRNSKIAIAAAVVALLLIGAGVAAYFYLRDDAPAAVNINNAVDDSSSTTTAMGDDTTSTSSATSTTTGDSTEANSSTTTTGAASSDTSIDGEWKLAPSTEAPDFEKPVGSFVGFRVDEELSTIGKTEAVGRTRSVTGDVTIANNQVTKTSFTVQMDTITTNESRRDNRAKAALGTTEFPTATFELTTPIDLGADAATKTVSVDAAGNLTIHGVTKPATFAIDAKLESGKVVMTGTTKIKLSDFGVQAPSAPIVLKVGDTATVEFQFFLTK